MKGRPSGLKLVAEGLCHKHNSAREQLDYTFGCEHLQTDEYLAYRLPFCCSLRIVSCLLTIPRGGPLAPTGVCRVEVVDRLNVTSKLRAPACVRLCRSHLKSNSSQRQAVACPTALLSPCCAALHFSSSKLSHSRERQANLRALRLAGCESIHPSIYPNIQANEIVYIIHINHSVERAGCTPPTNCKVDTARIKQSENSHTKFISQ